MRKRKKKIDLNYFFGDQCPFCHSTDLDYQPYDYGDNGNVTQDVVCTKCGAYWVNHYDLHFVMADNLERGDV